MPYPGGLAEPRNRSLRRRAAQAQRRLALEPLEPRTVMHAASGEVTTVFFSVATGMGPLAQISVPMTATNTPAGLQTTLSAALGQLQNHSDLLGLQPADLAANRLTSGYMDENGLAHFYLTQTFQGLDIENAYLNFSLAADGDWLALGGNFVPNLAAQSASVEPTIDAEAAVEQAAAQLGLGKVSTEVTRPGEGLARATELVSDASLDPIPANLAFFNTPAGLRLGWELVLREPGGEHWYHVGVDAANGAVIFESDWIDDLAAYYVYPEPGESPAHIARTYMVNPASETYSPYGWHDTNGVPGAEFTDTRGNNVFAQEDADDNDTGGSRPDGGGGLNFFAPIDLTQAPTTYTAGAVTNLFYWNNYLHDVHAAYGFTEAAGNFQFVNYSGLGLGNDHVFADAQDGSGTNNANFGTPPDGFNPRMQQFIFTLSSPFRDSDLENGIITHEYGHGISNRLTGGPANASALDALQSGGMGEGWSDWWAVMLTQRASDQANDARPMGNYVLNQPPTGDGIRRNPYSFDKVVNPITFADYAASTEVHDSGEIWASALWDLNWLLINKYGFDADLMTGYTGTGSGAAGNKLALRLVMDALKLQPANPTFIQARDAILAADTALTGGRNQREIWSAFARRNLGLGASTTDSDATTLTTSATMPAQFNNPGVITQSPTGRTTTAPSFVDLTFSEAMDPASFSLAADVVSFTGPGGVNLLPSLTGFSFSGGNTVLRINFAPQSAQGDYSLVLGPDIRDVSGNLMEQDGDATPGEATADRYTANFRYDALGLVVTSTTPTANTTVVGSFTTLDVTFNEAVAAASVGTDDLQLSQGTVTGFTILSPTQVRYNLSTLNPGVLAVNLKYNAVTDLAGFPSAFFEGVYGIPNTFAELIGGTLTVSDTPDGTSDDTIVISRVGANLRITESSGGFVAGTGVTAFNSTTVDIPFANITGSIIVNTLAGNDQVTIDFSGGDPIPSGGLTFNGGTNTAAGDRLILIGGALGAVTYTYTGANDGGISTALGAVNYTGAEALTNSGGHTSASFTPPAGADTMFLENDTVTGNNMSQLRSGGTFLTTVFAHPTASLSVAGGAGDTLTLNNVDNFASSVSVTAASIAVLRLSTSTTATLTATGSITEGSPDAAVDLIATTAILSGATGVATANALEMTVTTLEADGGSGGVNVSNSLPLTIGAAGGLTGVSATGGNIVVTATGAVTVNEAVVNSGSGTVNVTAANAVGGAYVISTPALSFQDIALSGGTRLTLSDDQMSSQLGLGFTFNFFGTDYTNVFINSNGFLTFVSGQSGSFYNADPIPTAATPNGIVAGFWNDLFPPNAPSGTDGGVFYQTIGSAPNRVFIAEYKNVPNYNNGANQDYTFQIKLFETTNVIEAHYLQVNNDGSSGAAGIENAAGTVGNQFFYGTGDIADNTAVRYSPPGPPNVVVNANVSSGGNVTLTAAGSILQNTGTVSATGTGSVNYTASTVALDGVITMATGTAAMANNGAITLTANGNITVGLLANSGVINITTPQANAGAILSGSGVADVIAASVNLTAGSGGIGASGNAFTTDAGTLATLSAGPQFLADTGSVQIATNDLNAGAQTITLAGGRFDTTATGSALSPLVIASGATLSGSGTAGAVSVQSGGTIAPGVTTATLNTGAATLASGGILSVNLNGTTAGTNYDVLNVVGPVNLTGAVLNVSLGFAAAFGNSFTILTNDGTDPILGTFAGLPEGQLFNVTGAFSGLFSITYVGGVDNNDVVLTRASDQLRVTTFTPTATGVRFVLSQPVTVVNTLNVFAHANLGPADIFLVDSGLVEIPGSLIPEAGDAAFTFVSANGILPPSTYTLTLRSAADAFHTVGGALLDGNDDGTPGGDYVNSFTVNAPAPNTVVLSVPAIARGADQAVNVPASSTLGLPLTASNAAGVTQIQLELRFDPGLLDVTNVTAAAGGSASFSITTGVVSATLNFGTPLAAGSQVVAYFTTTVPASASSRYGEREVLNLAALQVFAGATPIPALDADAAHVNAYYGDVGKNGGYDSFDVQQASRIALRLDSGFQAHPLLDPRIIGDFNGNGRVDSFDVQRISRLALRLPIDEAPELPNPLPGATVSGRLVAEEETKTEKTDESAAAGAPPVTDDPADSQPNDGKKLRSDVNHDGVVDPQDILFAIYYFNRSQANASLSAEAEQADINLDGQVAADDILFAITDYQAANKTEGESALDLLAVDVAAARKKK